MQRVSRIPRLGAIACALAMSACASVDFDHPKVPSRAFDRAEDPSLAPKVAAGEARNPGKSGFLLLEDGIDALSARLLLANRAKHSIDAQYYFLLDDVTTYAFLWQLLEAADRGVRVRLLIDDIHTAEYDRGMDALESHPNIEIRVFNPFARRRGRALDFVTDFSRANRRMHNKSFTVDGVATVVGGRNIGAEYFAARDDVNFNDLDVMGVGQVAAEVGRVFDVYWNSEHALPVTALVETQTGPDAGLPAMRERITAAVEEFKQTRYAEALTRTVVEQLEFEESDLVWADFQVVADEPDKARSDGSGRRDALRAPLRTTIDAAQHELFVTSPYFVPLAGGVDFFRELRARGMEVLIWTNSLSATDVPAVHAGYAPYRKELLRLGVVLYEARGDTQTRGARRGGMAYSDASLHAKWFAIDRRRLFVGSFNWDPRSSAINTEMGILIESPALAERLVSATLDEFQRNSYRVALDDRGRLRWTSLEAGETVVHRHEPNTGWWERFVAGILRVLPIRSQL